VKRAGEEDERVFAWLDVKALDSRHHDPVITGRVLGDDLALERREGVGDERGAGASGVPVEPGESVCSGGGRTRDEAFVVCTEHIDGEAPCSPHACPGV
jgi:hypothetical protein